jgi:hypothetical protein
MVDVLPLIAALWLASSALWGIDSRLRPVELPPEWAQARQIVNDNPGTVAALPWHQYFNLEVDGVRRVLNPLPLYLGGDVLISSDPELSEDDRRERVDPRELSMDAVVADAQDGKPVSDELARLGVRWVVLLHEVDWLSYEGVSHDPGLVQRVHAPALDLYEVAGWHGLVVDEQGAPVASQPLVEPVVRVDASGPAVYDRPAATGWMRGWQAAGATPEGLVALPAGSGLVWYWPSVLVLITTVSTYGAVMVVTWRVMVERRHRARSDPPVDLVA